MIGDKDVANVLQEKPSLALAKDVIARWCVLDRDNTVGQVIMICATMRDFITKLPERAASAGPDGVPPVLLKKCAGP